MLLSLVANTVAAQAAIVLAAISIVALYSGIRRAKFLVVVDLILRLDERFNRTEMVNSRRKAARSAFVDNWDDVEDVLDFFEEFAFIAKRHAVDDEVIWHEFYWWIHRYFVAARPHIEETWKDDPNQTPKANLTHPSKIMSKLPDWRQQATSIGRYGPNSEV